MSNTMNTLISFLPKHIETLNKIHEEFGNNYGKFIPETRNGHTMGVHYTERAAQFMYYTDLGEIKYNLIDLAKEYPEFNADLKLIELQHRKVSDKLNYRPQSLTNEMIAQFARKYSMYYTQILNKIYALKQ